MDAAEVRDMLDVAGHVKVSLGHVTPNPHCNYYSHAHPNDSIHLVVVQLSQRVDFHLCQCWDRCNLLPAFSGQ
jgi:hypothetical protein